MILSVFCIMHLGGECHYLSVTKMIIIYLNHDSFDEHYPHLSLPKKKRVKKAAIQARSKYE